MDFGVGYFPTHDAMAPGALAQREERGQSALFFAEHTHIPASRETPYGDTSRWLPSADRGTVERALEHRERAIAEFTGEQR